MPFLLSASLPLLLPFHLLRYIELPLGCVSMTVRGYLAGPLEGTAWVEIEFTVGGASTSTGWITLDDWTRHFSILMTSEYTGVQM